MTARLNPCTSRMRPLRDLMACLSFFPGPSLNTDPFWPTPQRTRSGQREHTALCAGMKRAYRRHDDEVQEVDHARQLVVVGVLVGVDAVDQGHQRFQDLGLVPGPKLLAEVLAQQEQRQARPESPGHGRRRYGQRGDQVHLIEKLLFRTGYHVGVEELIKEAGIYHIE